MPIKRRERENSSENNTKTYRMDHIPTDHELFLQAFESKWFYDFSYKIFIHAEY